MIEETVSLWDYSKRGYLFIITSLSNIYQVFPLFVLPFQDIKFFAIVISYGNESTKFMSSLRSGEKKMTYPVNPGYQFNGPMMG